MTQAAIQMHDYAGINTRGMADEIFAALAESHGLSTFKPPGESTWSTAVSAEQLLRPVFAADFVTTDGVAPDPRRSTIVAPDTTGYYPPSILSAIGVPRQTEQSAIVYSQEDIDASAAVEVAEAAKEAEADFHYDNVTAAVRTIRADIPVSNEQLDDVPMARTLIEGRLRRFAQLRLDRQIIHGNGTAPNLQGILGTTGVGSQSSVVAKASFDGSALIDEIIEAVVEVASQSNGVYAANAVFLNWKAWKTLAAAKATDKQYIQLPDLPPIIPTPYFQDLETDGNTYGLVGDFGQGCDVYMRKNVEIDAGWIADDFAKYTTRLRVSMRAALAVYAPKAFVALTRDFS